MGVMVRGHGGCEREVDEQLASEVKARGDALTRANPWLARIDGAVEAIVNADVTHRKRYRMLKSLADRLNAAMAPHSACRKRCSSCCHIQVEMSGWEAAQLGRELGLVVKTPGPTHDAQNGATEMFGRPCGFLKDGQCGIYDQRPLACRLHHSLNATNEMCSVAIAPSESLVPTANLESFWIGYAYLGMGSAVGDISAFFDEAQRGPRVESAWVAIERERSLQESKSVINRGVLAAKPVKEI